MSPYRRNVVLGATVVFALAILGWMILQFGGQGVKLFAQPTITVKFIADRADGVADGSSITFRGVDSGHVTRVALMKDRPQVEFEGVINREPALPANVVAKIRTASALGSGSMISLEVEGPETPERLKEGTVISARFIGFGELLPMTEFADLAGELTLAARQLRESNLIPHLDEQVRNAGKTIDSIQQILGDPKVQTDLRTSISDLREVMASAKSLAGRLDKFADDLQKTAATANETLADARTQITRTGNNVETLTRQMGDRLTQVAKLLEQFQSIADKVDKGQGTAGQIVNDNRLYESLVDTSRELNATIKDLKRLVEQWEQEGVTLKLK